MRSFLTMLGIIIGVASVIILVGIVNGYMSYMVESFSSMGVNQITARYTPLPSRSMWMKSTISMRNTAIFMKICPRPCR